MYGIILIISILTICFTILGIFAYIKTSKGGAQSYGLLFQRALRFYTVIFIIFALIALNVIGEPSYNVYIILSGIAGYVLGGIREPADKKENEKASSSNIKLN